MPTERTFQIVFVAENHGTGIEPVSVPDKVVQYIGQQITVTP
jgi:hypothetical protein